MNRSFLGRVLSAFEDQIFATVASVSIALLVFVALECWWQRWRDSHPRRRSPSKQDWARIRAAETRAAANR
ncbi:hypothetical protein BKA25_002430 [Actinoalloteichus hymeniacidonis]|uniref:Uncharacterized protein n=1 Tax=Actinoalloteichus hymeniacidonis TaxID=340345 RepID=A0AAC9HRV7_9PSEU|nr:hypothetical protein TL08_15110 [Actinoalloteichus hymeniacidonis]MBB5908114.1 hypothetical protein [Actinoalloteichus hymeniacidonis]